MAGMTVAGRVDVGTVLLGVDIVPFAGLSVMLVPGPPVGFSVLVGPSRLTGDVVRREAIRVGRQDSVDLRLRGGIEEMIGNQRDDLVPLVTPCVCVFRRASKPETDGCTAQDKTLNETRHLDLRGQSAGAPKVNETRRRGYTGSEPFWVMARGQVIVSGDVKAVGDDGWIAPAPCH
jgi:hypothetical protein